MRRLLCLAVVSQNPPIGRVTVADIPVPGLDQKQLEQVRSVPAL
jgi:hypothetical protein